MRIEECLERVVIHKITPVEGVFGVDDPVDASHELTFIGLYRDTIGNLATGVRRLGQVLGESHRNGIEEGRTDLVVGQRDAGGGIFDDASHARGLAAGAVEPAEVAGERRASGNKSVARGRVLPNIRSLKTGEKE